MRKRLVQTVWLVLNTGFPSGAWNLAVCGVGDAHSTGPPTKSQGTGSLLAACHSGLGSEVLPVTAARGDAGSPCLVLLTSPLEPLQSLPGPFPVINQSHEPS